MLSIPIKRQPRSGQNYSKIEALAKKGLTDSCNSSPSLKINQPCHSTSFFSTSQQKSKLQTFKESALVKIDELIISLTKESTNTLDKQKLAVINNPNTRLLPHEEIFLLNELSKEINYLNSLGEINKSIKAILDNKIFSSKEISSSKIKSLLEDLLNESFLNTKEYYAHQIQDAIKKINSSPQSKTSSTIPDIILGIQEKWSELKLSDNSIKEDIAKLKNLQIESLSDDKSCQDFVYAIYYLAQHRDSWRRFITPSKKTTRSIKNILKDIGYVHKQRFYLPNEISLIPYSGFTTNYRAHGFGKATWPNGAQYEGYWQNGTCCDGFGIMTWTNGDRYEGSWQDGKFKGFGGVTWTNSDRYEGSWQDGKHSGFKAFTQANGYLTKGYYWQDGKANGFGVLTLANGDRCEGYWQDGKANGFGVLTLANGMRYEGDWQGDNKANGFGIATWANGERYEGNWQDNKRSGFGITTWANGERYEGNWQDNKRSGFGIVTLAGRTISEGRWKNGLFSQARPIAQTITEGKHSLALAKEKMTISFNKHLEARKKLKKQREDYYSPTILSSTHLIGDLSNIVIDFL